MTEEKWPFDQRAESLIPEIKAIELILASREVNATLKRSLKFRLKTLTKGWHEASLRELADRYDREGSPDAGEAMRVVLARVRRYRVKARKRRENALIRG